MNKTLTIVAATVLMGSTAVAPMAFAQSATTPATPGATTTAPATAPATAAGGMSETYLTQQGSDQLSASNYIGQNVYAGDKSIGEIKDLIMQQNGGLVAAVIGVGGFLGMGEKNVAVPVSKITVTRDAQNPDKLRLTTTETADTLKSAPEFKTLSDQKSNAASTTTPAAPSK